jgi:hypothetical protein
LGERSVQPESHNKKTNTFENRRLYQVYEKQSLKLLLLSDKKEQAAAHLHKQLETGSLPGGLLFMPSDFK